MFSLCVAIDKKEGLIVPLSFELITDKNAVINNIWKSFQLNHLLFSVKN